MGVHNGERYLAQSVQSVLGQSFADFEFIIVDDASTDGSPAYLAGLGDPRVRVVRNPAQIGLTASLNRGLEVCRAPLVARMDDDDVCEPGRFAEQLAWLEAHPDCVGCGTHTREIDDDGRETGVFAVCGEPDYVKWSMAYRSVVAHPSVMMRTAAVRSAGGYDTSMTYSQDYDLFARIVQRGERLGIVEKPLLQYRRRGRSITATKAAEQRRLADLVQVRYLRWLLGRTCSQEEARSLRELLSYDPQFAWDRLRGGLGVLEELWALMSPSMNERARSAVRADIADRLRSRASRALAESPVSAWHLAGAIRRITRRRGEALALKVRAARCHLGQLRRGLGSAAPPQSGGATWDG
jgi:glycosyltransferase involved in cell wall biosynthesis